MPYFDDARLGLKYILDRRQGDSWDNGVHDGAAGFFIYETVKAQKKRIKHFVPILNVEEAERALNNDLAPLPWVYEYVDLIKD